MFVTKFLIHVTNFVTHVSKFVIYVTKFVTKTILYEPKNYLADNENYLADSKNYLADSGARNGLCRAQPKISKKMSRKGAYMNQCQDKTNPSLVTGLRCKPYTCNPFDYRWLCELVLG